MPSRVCHLMAGSQRLWFDGKEEIRPAEGEPRNHNPVSRVIFPIPSVSMLHPAFFGFLGLPFCSPTASLPRWSLPGLLASPTPKLPDRQPSPVPELAPTAGLPPGARPDCTSQASGCSGSRPGDTRETKRDYWLGGTSRSDLPQFAWHFVFFRLRNSHRGHVVHVLYLGSEGDIGCSVLAPSCKEPDPLSLKFGAFISICKILIFYWWIWHLFDFCDSYDCIIQMYHKITI